jgi:hypothetical protein
VTNAASYGINKQLSSRYLGKQKTFTIQDACKAFYLSVEVKVSLSKRNIKYTPELWKIAIEKLGPN